jgi:hypothetical protein
MLGDGHGCGSRGRRRREEGPDRLFGEAWVSLKRTRQPVDKACLDFPWSGQCGFTIPRAVVVVIALVPLAARRPGTAAVGASSAVVVSVVVSIIVPMIISITVSVVGSCSVRVAQSIVVVHFGGGRNGKYDKRRTEAHNGCGRGCGCRLKGYVDCIWMTMLQWMGRRRGKLERYLGIPAGQVLSRLASMYLCGTSV